VEVRPNEEFVIQVLIDGIDDLGGFQFELAHDPSVSEVTDVVLGDFLGSSGRSVVPLGPEVSDEEGIVALGAVTFGEQEGPGGSGLLATITCRARAAGSSVLTLQDVRVLDTAATVRSVEIEDGQIIAEEAGVSTATPAVAGESEAQTAAAPSGAASPTSTPVATGEPVQAATELPLLSPTSGAPTSTEEVPTGTAAAVPMVTPTAGDSAGVGAESTPTGVAAPSTSPTAEAMAAGPTATPSPASGTSASAERPEASPAAPPQVAEPTIRWGWGVVGLLLVAGTVAIFAFGILFREPEG
jgi:hypothetical protein